MKVLTTSPALKIRGYLMERDAAPDFPATPLANMAL